MTMVERLLWLADELIASSMTLRSSTVERRAVSTAYYAVFHALTKLCADQLLGGDKATGKTKEYERVYRALDHGSLKTAFKSEPLKNNQRLTEIGDRVVRLQSERIRSDYHPGGRLHKRAECAELVSLARSTINLIDVLPADDRRKLAVYLVFKNRPQ